MGPQLGPGLEDITWPNQVAPRSRKASSTRKFKPQTSNQLGCKQDKQPGGVPMILSVTSLLVRVKCSSGGSRYSCKSGPKETPYWWRGCLGYTTASLSLQHPQFA